MRQFAIGFLLSLGTILMLRCGGNPEVVRAPDPADAGHDTQSAVDQAEDAEAVMASVLDMARAVEQAATCEGPCEIRFSDGGP